jgi:hypothetical protein
MDAASIYRTLLITRGGWAILEWPFGFGPQRVDSFTLLHPYASLFADAIAVAFFASYSHRPVVLLPVGASSLCSASCRVSPNITVPDSPLYFSARTAVCHDQFADARVDWRHRYNVVSVAGA